MVRKAKQSDISAINDLGLLINNKFCELFNMGDILEEQISLVTVYELDNKVVGFLHVTILYETVDIINIAVDPEYQRRNIAYLLLDDLISSLDKQQYITLEVANNNIAAIKLYEKFGFEIINTRKMYYQGGIDAYVMGMKINEK